MNAALQHRGPDDTGQLDVPCCSIAMRRLSIIDLKGGHQPMFNEDGSLAIVFNGEIYNFQEIRHQLENSGRHQFRTRSDTEVILHLYEEKGAETPALLRGMFSFCIYDRNEDSMFLARDRFGEKPLYYSIHNGALAFSSELPSLLQWNKLPRKLNVTALFYLLNFGFIPPPLTMFQQIVQLPAGHSLLWRHQTSTITGYFHPVYSPDKALSDERTAVEALQVELTKAVKSQMISDVPLGAFLSGGIDSSTVVAAMQQHSSRPVKTFTVRFEPHDYDESAIARQVAQHLGTEHHEFFIGNGGFEAEDLWRILGHFGQPFLDSSAIPTYWISRQIRQHATVALSGDGGDEMFAGYRFFTDSLAVDRLARVPRPFLALGRGILANVTTLPGRRQEELLRKARRALELTRLPAWTRPAYMETLFDAQEMQRLITPELSRQFAGVTDTYTSQTLSEADYAGRLRQLMHYWAAFRLPEDMLAKVDRMSMAASLEVRCPLLSTEVSDLAMKLPDSLLIRGKTTKYLLRQAGRPWLPDCVYSRPKMGFTIPLHSFLNERCNELSQQYLNGSGNPIVRELFRTEGVNAFVKRGLEFKRSNAEISVHRTSHQVWALLQLSSWAACFNVTL
jgi:asparagine synthase (glutamine-hydrolysing)